MKKKAVYLKSVFNLLSILMILGIFLTIGNEVSAQTYKLDEFKIQKNLSLEPTSLSVQYNFSIDNKNSKVPELFEVSKFNDKKKSNLFLAKYPNLGLKTTRRLLKLKYVSFIVNCRKVNYFA